jgi:hypothetical protein
MNAQRIFVWLLILFLVLALRPAGLWRELKNIWRRREFIIRVLFALAATYFLYGLYTLYSQGKLGW